MRVATATAALLAVASALLIYGLVITPQMDSGVAEQGYRPPDKTKAPPREQKQPLQESNVPPIRQALGLSLAMTMATSGHSWPVRLMLAADLTKTRPASAHRLRS